MSCGLLRRTQEDPMVRFALFTGALACAAIGGALIASSTEPSVTATSPAGAPSPRDSAASPSTTIVRAPARDLQIRALRDEVAALREEVAAQPARDPKPPEPEPELSAEEHLDRARAWQESYAHRLDGVFADDVADGDALEAETRASELLTSLAPASSHVAVSCRAMLCRAEVHHADATDHEALTLRVTDAQSLEGPAFFVPIPDGAEPRTVVYLARAGYDLPSPE